MLASNKNLAALVHFSAHWKLIQGLGLKELILSRELIRTDNIMKGVVWNYDSRFFRTWRWRALLRRLYQLLIVNIWQLKAILFEIFVGWD